MRIVPFQLASQSKIAVDGTARTLLSFFGTHQSFASAGFGETDSVDITPEDGDVRFLVGGITPTATNGHLIKQGTTYRLRGDARTLKLISTTGTVNCSILIGVADPGEDSSSSGGGASSGGGGGAMTIADGADTALGAKADAVASSDTGTASLIALIKRLLEKITENNTSNDTAILLESTTLADINAIENTTGIQVLAKVVPNADVATISDTSDSMQLLKINENGALHTHNPYLDGGEREEYNTIRTEPWYLGDNVVKTRITTATTTTVATQAGRAACRVVKDVANAVITGYDNPSAGSGTIAFRETSSATAGSPRGIVEVGAFATGLTIVTSLATEVEVYVELV
jgi:hypothetical protein